MDWDMFHKDDYVGTCTVSASELQEVPMEGGAHDTKRFEIPLVGKDGKPVVGKDKNPAVVLLQVRRWDAATHGVGHEDDGVHAHGHEEATPKTKEGSKGSEEGEGGVVGGKKGADLAKEAGAGGERAREVEVPAPKEGGGAEPDTKEAAKESGGEAHGGAKASVKKQKIELMVVSARHLPKTDTFGSCD
eukprot:2217072-Rhodomonas_salina.1